MTTTQARELTILEKLDKKVAGDLTIGTAQGGISFANMGEVLEFSKLLSISQHAVPPHCRNNPGLCLGITVQAIEWRMSPYSVAGKSYVVNDKLAYESQLIHAVIEQRAPLTARLRHSFSGEGGKRRCKVWATAKGETEPLEYTSPEFDKITPKNSPLWKTKPDLQLFYNASRDWARMYFPDVIMGVYAEDELEAVASYPAPRQGGMAGLKSTLAVAGPEDNPADDIQEGIDEQPTDEIDQTTDGDDGVNQDAGNPASASPEELQEQQEHPKAKGKRGSGLFGENAPQYE